MPLTKDQILAALPSLSQADLKALGAVIGGLVRAEAPDASNDPTAWLAEALGAVTGVSWLGGAGAAFNKNAPLAIKFMQTHFTGALNNKITALALMRYLLLLLVANLKEMKVPVSRLTLSQNLHRLGEVFNDAFPGYGNGKAAKLVMAAVTNGQNSND